MYGSDYWCLLIIRVDVRSCYGPAVLSVYRLRGQSERVNATPSNSLPLLDMNPAFIQEPSVSAIIMKLSLHADITIKSECGVVQRENVGTMAHIYMRICRACYVYEVQKLRPKRCTTAVVRRLCRRRNYRTPALTRQVSLREREKRPFQNSINPPPPKPTYSRHTTGGAL